MFFETGFDDVGEFGDFSQENVPSDLRLSDLPNKRLLGKGLASIGYETEWKGVRYARKDFVAVPSDIFRREAGFLLDLPDHENVVKTHGLTVDKLSCSLVLDYMDDKLTDLLKKRKDLRERSPAGEHGPTLQESLGVILQIARAMGHLHKYGILHGDLKSRNILVTYMNDKSLLAKSVKVADFGLVQTKRNSMPYVSHQARKLDMVRWKAPENLVELFREATSSGPDSDSDEELTGSAHCVTQSDDAYCFGLTCFQILTGEEPYNPKRNWKELVIDKVSNKGGLKLPPNLSCPQDLRELLDVCCDADPDRRPAFVYIREKLEHMHSLQPWIVKVERKQLEKDDHESELNDVVESVESNQVSEGLRIIDETLTTVGNIHSPRSDAQIEHTLSGDSLIGRTGLGYYDLRMAGRMLTDYINDLITPNASPDMIVQMKIQEYKDLRDELKEEKKWGSGDNFINERLLITPQQRSKLILMLHDYQSVLEPENQAEYQIESPSRLLDLEPELRFHLGEDESEISTEVPLYISDSDFSHGHVYAVTLTAALEACEKHVHVFKNVLPSVVIFTRLCKYLVGTVSPVAGAKFERYRIVLDLLHKMDPENAPIPTNLRNSISFCFESLVGLARRFQLVEELLRKCSSPEWYKSALELANGRPRKHVTRWSEFSLSVRDCEWSLDIVELAFHALEKLLTQGQYTVKDTSFKWSCKKGRMVLQIPGKLDRQNTMEELTQLSKEWRTMEEDDMVELVEKLEGLVKSEQERKHLSFRRSKYAERIASFLSEKLQGPTPEVGTYVPYSFSKLIHPSNLKYLEYLDKGSSGMVAIHDWFGMKVAVKSVRAIGLSRAKFEQEAAVLAMSQHPNVVRLIGCGFLEKNSSGSGTGQLVMELMDHDLRSIIEYRQSVLPKGSSPFSPVVAIDLMLQIAEAMLYLFENRILHRDLKAKNVLVNICKPLKLTSKGLDTAYTSLMASVSAVLPHTQENYVAKLADFGEARCCPQSSYVTTAMSGTTGWRAPEIYHVPDSELEDVCQWPADVYSFAMTGYEIVTGKLPFEEEPTCSLYGKIMTGERPSFENLRQDFPEALKELIQDCWATDPNDRPNFKDIVKRLWECKVLAILPGFERKIMQTASAPASRRFH